MKTVKTFANLAEAGFASSLLEASGIPALLADEQCYLKWEYYDGEGRPERLALDENFDGRPDCWYFYENGALVRSERDTDFNGAPDWFGYYETGILVREDCRPNNSEIVVRRLIYEHAVLREEWGGRGSGREI